MTLGIWGYDEETTYYSRIYHTHNQRLRFPCGYGAAKRR